LWFKSHIKHSVTKQGESEREKESERETERKKRDTGEEQERTKNSAKVKISYRSASSRTTIVTRFNETSLPACIQRISIILPGVQTTISLPRFRSAICSAIPAPPIKDERMAKKRKRRRIRGKSRKSTKQRSRNRQSFLDFLLSQRYDSSSCSLLSFFLAPTFFSFSFQQTKHQ
jgi:hypothetical protein